MVKGKRAENEPKKPRGRPPGSTKKPKTKPDAPGAVIETAPPEAGHNSGSKTPASRLTDGEERELFGRHRTIWNGLTAKQKMLDEQWSRAKADIKADGFKVLHMNIADALINPKGEKKVHAEVRDRLWVARMIGHALGRQMDLFEAPDRTPAVDRAYENGRTASIDNAPRRCDYHESTEQYREFMRGYNDHQEELLSRVGTGGGELEPAGEEPDESEVETGPEESQASAANVVSRDEFRNRLQGHAKEVDAGIKGFGK